MNAVDDATIAGRVTRARAAQIAWAARPLAARLAVVAGLRGLLAARAEALVAAVGEAYGRSAAETLTAELIPLADACRFLERRAAAILAPRRLGPRGRPLWLLGVRGEIKHEALGVVLIIAPGNYRLLLAGVQMIQALTAGNAVLLKPAPGAGAALTLLRALAVEAGAPAELVQVLADDAASAGAAIAAGVDKVLLTGSAATGRRVLAELAPRLVPAALELSGDDAVFVLADADLDLVAASVGWGLGLNAGATCIAPRRIYVERGRFAALAARLAARLEDRPARPVDAAVKARALAAIEAALAAGYRRLGARPEPTTSAMAPLVLAHDGFAPPPLPADLFAPVAALVAVPDMATALALDADRDYALGAAVFGGEASARALAAKIDAGTVVVNDLIVPSADPRVAFGGARASGYGRTRGPEGLRELTATRTVLYRRGRRRPHLEAETPQDHALFTAFLRLTHGHGLTTRGRALVALARALRRRGNP